GVSAIRTPLDGKNGIQVDGAGATINIGANSGIQSNANAPGYAILANSSGLTINNSGKFLNTQGRILLFSNTSTASVLNNTSTGVIESVLFPTITVEGGPVTIKNSGIIKAPQTAEAIDVVDTVFITNDNGATIEGGGSGAIYIRTAPVTGQIDNSGTITG